jgi:hypothetical protein
MKTLILALTLSFATILAPAMLAQPAAASGEIYSGGRAP